MSIATAITAAQGRMADAYTAISNKGGTLPATQNLANMPTAIGSIPTGPVPKFGLTIDNFIGNVSSGTLSRPPSLSSISFDGVTDFGNYALQYKFYNYTLNNNTTVSFPDLTTISGTSALDSAFYGCNGTAISFSFPNLTIISGEESCKNAFNSCRLTSISFPSLGTISGNYGCSYMFYLSKIATIDLSSLKTISGSYGFQNAFGYCPFSTVSFDALDSIDATKIFQNAFMGCTYISSISFPALKTTSFGSYTDQFSSMFNSGAAFYSGSCMVHFPSNLQTIVSGLTGYPTFGGNSSRIAIAFDLPETS